MTPEETLAILALLVEQKVTVMRLKQELDNAKDRIRELEADAAPNGPVPRETPEPTNV